MVVTAVLDPKEYRGSSAGEPGGGGTDVRASSTPTLTQPVTGTGTGATSSEPERSWGGPDTAWGASEVASAH